jgi:hypothetical protein
MLNTIVILSEARRSRRIWLDPWPGWAGHRSFVPLRMTKLRGRAFAKPGLNPKPVEGSKDLVRQLEVSSST